MQFMFLWYSTYFIPACVLSCSVIADSFATPWTVAHQDPLSMGFFWQEYWSGLSFPPPGDLPNPETEPTSPAFADRFFIIEPQGNNTKYYLLL